MRVEAKDAVAALSELSEMGFTHGFRIQNGRVMDVSTGIPVAPAEVVVVTKLRFKPKAPRRTIGASRKSKTSLSTIIAEISAPMPMVFTPS